MKTKTRIYVLVAIIAAAIALWSALSLLLHKPLQYDLINLGNFGREHIEPHAINDYGQIVGHFTPANSFTDGPSRAFFYDDVNGFNEIDRRCTSIWGLDINNRGQVVAGDAENPVLATISLFVWDLENGTTDIIGETGKILGFGNIEVNNKGRVVGTIKKSDPSLHEAFIWDEERGFTRLGTLGGKNSVACSINDKGQIAGWSETYKGYTHAFIFDDVNGMIDLGTLGGDESRAFAVNNRGQVLGYSSDSKYDSYLVIWDERNNPRRIKRTGYQSGRRSHALNDYGQVIGNYPKETRSWSVGKWFFKRRRQTRSCPFIWSERHGCVDLDSVFAADPKWQSFYIVDMNNRGQILGFGRRFNDGHHIFILQPKNGKAKTASER